MADDPDQLIHEFVEVYYQALHNISERQQKQAQQNYMQLYATYNLILNAPLDEIHKRVAYDRLVAIHQRLQQPAKAPKQPRRLVRGRDIVVITVLVLLFGALLFIKPEIIGLALLQDTTTLDLNLEIIESGSRDITLTKTPTGSVDNGNAKIFLQTDTQKLLIVDATPGTFSTCADTCRLKDIPNKFKLVVELDQGATLHLDSLTYRSSKQNQEPVWTSQIADFDATTDSTLVLDASDLFDDPDGDALTFLSTDAEGLEVDVSGSIISFTPTTTGTYSITLIASDGKDATRIPVNITVT